MWANLCLTSMIRWEPEVMNIVFFIFGFDKFQIIINCFPFSFIYFNFIPKTKFSGVQRYQPFTLNIVLSSNIIMTFDCQSF